MELLEEKLGYHFKNPELLKNALTHSSYANEQHLGAIGCNERLEFLGDSVLGMIVAEHLFRTCTTWPEGDLTRVRASLVCEENLAKVARELDLGSYLLLGKGEESNGGRTRSSIIADAVEAVLAAVYLDGGIDPVIAIIRRYILDRADISVPARRDYKTALQELIQRKSGKILSYQLTGSTGPDHAKTFYMQVLLNGEPIGEGIGHSKKEAEQNAAKAGYEALTK